MPNPQNSSISRSFPPVSADIDWAQHARSEADFLRIRSALRGTPHGWFRSVEDTVQRANRARIPIREPLTYRLANLVAGTINLQEAKYLTDVFENALRHAFVQHMSEHSLK